MYCPPPKAAIVPSSTHNIIAYFLKGKLVASRIRRKKIEFLREEASASMKGYEVDAKLTAFFTCFRAGTRACPITKTRDN